MFFEFNSNLLQILLSCSFSISRSNFFKALISSVLVCFNRSKGESLFLLIEKPHLNFCARINYRFIGATKSYGTVVLRQKWITTTLLLQIQWKTLKGVQKLNKADFGVGNEEFFSKTGACHFNTSKALTCNRSNVFGGHI